MNVADLTRITDEDMGAFSMSTDPMVRMFFARQLGRNADHEFTRACHKVGRRPEDCGDSSPLLFILAMQARTASRH